MQYRVLPKIPELSISVLSLGAMRLPLQDSDEGRIDPDGLDGILKAAHEAGINYLDTAYIYHNGKSEEAVGRSLDRTGLRGKFLLATKSPTWLVKSESDWEKFLSAQLERLGTERIDFYLLHALTIARWEKTLRLKGLEFLRKAKEDGRIGHVGFSFHDSLEVFKKIVDGWKDWEFCQIQYNYLDTEFQAGREGIRYAASKELGVIVMEPLRGGGLAVLPREAREVFGRWPVPRMPAEWALRFALDPQEVVTVLSGMGSGSQVWENAAVADAARANSITAKETALYDQVRAYFKEKMPVPCTTCGYCLPCPNKIPIPEIFAIYNTWAAFPDRREDRRRWYDGAYRKSGIGGDACVSCGECLPKCPQGIAIPDRLAEAHKNLS